MSKIRSVIESQWYRLDAETGELLAVNALTVARAAKGAFDAPDEVVKTGRFRTPFAIYSRGDNLTVGERTVPGYMETK